jgi:hypothetical protein
MIDRPAAAELRPGDVWRVPALGRRWYRARAVSPVAGVPGARRVEAGGGAVFYLAASAELERLRQPTQTPAAEAAGVEASSDARR